ncbi:MAG: restriction endonuclease subunit S [Actinobacteria bacterium]|nr:restriction endonuclease subunit S [Actinomycetota bacterium]
MSDSPAGWVEATIHDVCEVILGQSPPGRAYNCDGRGLPFFQGKAEFGPLMPATRKWTSEGNKRAREGDVLVSVRAPVGPTNLAPFECVIGRGLAALRPTDATRSRFVLYQMRATEELLASVATGSTFTAVAGDQIRRHPFLVPPTAEQDRIVAAIEEQFSRLDAAERSLQSARRRLHQLRARVIDAATDGYPMKTLGELLREPLRNGHSAKRSPGGKIPVFTLTAVTARDFSDRNMKLTDADPRRVENLWVESGDILIERSNTPELVGTAALYSGPSKRAIFPDLLIRVRMGSAILPEYAELGLRSTRLRRHFQRTAKGIAGSMPKIDQGAILAAQLPLPPSEEQHRIVAAVSRELTILDSLTTAIDHALIRSEQVRRAILGRAFSGRLVPQDPSDEPASVLLNRVERERGEPKEIKRRLRGRVGTVKS